MKNQQGVGSVIYAKNRSDKSDQLSFNRSKATRKNSQSLFVFLITLLFVAITPAMSIAQTYVGATSTPGDNATQAGPTVAVNPAGVGTLNIGDLVIIYGMYRGNAANVAISETGGQNWITAHKPTTTTEGMTYAIYWCRYNGSWIANPSVTVGTGTNAMSAIMYVFRPSVNTKGWHITAGPTQANTANNATTGVTLSALTATANSVSIAFWGTPNPNTWGSLTAGWTKPGLTQYRNTTTTGVSHTAAYKIFATAGGTGTPTQTRSAGTMVTQGVSISWSEGNTPANDMCANASTLNSASTCVTTGGTLNYALFTSDGGPAGCGSGKTDVWYKFVAKSHNPRITTTLTSGAGQRRFELYKGACGTLESVACSGDNDVLNTSDLKWGDTYYVRVYSENNAPYSFNICVQDLAASNGTCATARVLTPATSCTPVQGSLFGANQTNPNQSCGDYYDVWYQYTAPAGYNFANISVTPRGTPQAINSSNTFIEAFKSNCGSLNNNSLSCSNIGLVRTMSIAAGTTYFFRVYTTVNPTSTSSSYDFDICITLSNSFTDRGSRKQEIFKQTILSAPNILNDPWEITYGPDDKLWITESKGYKVYRMDPSSGVKTTVLDISQNATFLPLADRTFNCQFANGANAQGGLAGLVLHPDFNKGLGKDYVYISYIHTAGTTTTYPGNTNPCRWFVNRLVRFTYDQGTGTLGSPVSLCDTLPGGNDHNSQRIGIAKVGGQPFLFYASGDLGAGQLDCYNRLQKAQMINSYEGKILRFNLDPTGPTNQMNSWIPTDNPYNATLGVRSAVWVTGIRNNQGFAYDEDLDIFYGSSHGPYSDDEINVIEKGRNYGHPMVIGYVSDGNYNGDTTQANQRFSGGAPFNGPSGGYSTNWAIGSESAQRDVINSRAVGLLGQYKDPLFSAYAELPSGPGSVKTIWQTNPNNGGWPSEGWSGLDLYQNSMIPGWKKSLVAASLKWGRLVRIKLGSSGQITVPSNNAVNNAGDTISYFGSINRFRDLAFGPGGKDIYVIMDKSTTTSGPSSQWPVVPACQGCLQKYTFLGYNVNASSQNRSTIDDGVSVNPGLSNACETMNEVTINATNDNNDLWVPITDGNSNIVAEIYAMGQNLDRVRTSVYHNSNAVRSKAGKKYLDRNITITPDVQPAGDVKIRLYVTKQELDAMIASPASGVAGIADLKIVKNNDACGSTMTAATTAVPMDFTAEAFGTDAYVLQGTVSSFSTFYFGSAAMATLPLELVSFKGNLQGNNTLLTWETAQEVNTSHFIVERSIDATNYTYVGTVTASGNVNHANYSLTDYDAGRLPVTAIYYRLKMVDRDGQYTYSNIVHVMLPYVAGKVVVTPNPVVDLAHVLITTANSGKANWKIIDNTGRVVMTGVTTLQPGNNQLLINMNRFPGGIYFLDVNGGGTNYQVKLQKL